MSELEKLAKEGRENRAERGRRDPQPSAARSAPAKPKGEELRRMRRAIVGATPWGSPAAIVASCFAAAGAGVAAGLVSGLGMQHSAMLAGGVLLAWVGIYFAAVRPMAFRAERRWMERLPYRFDVDGYSRKLGKKRKKTKVRVLLHLEQPIPKDSRKLLRDAADGVHPDARGKLDGDDTLVISAEISTRVERQLGSDTNDGDPYRNEPVHRFVRTVLRDGVATIHASHPVSRVSVRLSGGG